VLATGDALLGVTYGKDAHGSGGGSGSSALSSSSSALSSPSSSSSTSRAGPTSQPLVLAEPSHLAPGGAFGKWVPTSADVQPVTAATPAPGLRDLGKRARAAFRDTPETMARFNLDGRRMLRDYDLVDVLPRAHRRRKGGGAAGAGTGAGGGGHASLTEALARVHGDSLGHVGPPPSSQFPGALAPRRGAADGSGGGNDDDDNDGPLSPTALWRGRFGFSQATWYMARVRIHMSGDAPGLGGGGDGDGADADAGGSGSGTRDDDGAADGEDGEAGGAKGGKGAKKPSAVAYAYWFEPAVGDNLAVFPVLRIAPVSDVLVIAPAGTYSCPFVPGQRLDSRRMSGKWAPAEVVAADRHRLLLRAARPDRALDLNASAPHKLAIFKKSAARMRVWVAGIARSAVTPRAKQQKDKDGAGSPGSASKTPASEATAEGSPGSAGGSRRDRVAAAMRGEGAGEGASSSSIVSPSSATAPASASATPMTPGDASASEGVGGVGGGEDSASAGIPTEEIPQHLWQYQIARAGFFCAADAVAAIPDFGTGKKGSGKDKKEAPAGAVATATAYVMEAERARKRAGSIFA
jgi:hypothetical protein